MEDLIYVCIAVGIAVLISLAEKKGKSRKSEQTNNVKFNPKPTVSPDITDFGDDFFESATPPPIPGMSFQLPEEGQRVSDDSDTEDFAAIVEEKERRVAAHRRRWRKAIVDTEILRPKF